MAPMHCIVQKDGSDQAHEGWQAWAGRIACSFDVSPRGAQQEVAWRSERMMSLVAISRSVSNVHLISVLVVDRQLGERLVGTQKGTKEGHSVVANAVLRQIE